MVTKRPHPTDCAGRHRRPCRTVVVPAAAAVALVAAVVRNRAGQDGRAGRWAGRLRPRVRRLEVSGPSMLPSLVPGDRLVAAGPWRLAPGLVVALADPRESGRLLVKRVGALDGDLVTVLGDNAGASTDSRHFGPVRRGAIEGVVVYRYHPPDRSGWWPGRIG